MTIRDELDNVFRAERSLREAEARLLASSDADALIELLSGAVAEARKLGDRREAAMRLERLADLCAQVPGPAMADALVSILDDDDPGVRVAAGEALRDLGYDRYAEVARAVERALERGETGPAMAELPWILAEIGEPSAIKLVERFLALGSAEIVASSVEALATLGDPAAVRVLEPLVADARKVTLEEDDASMTTTIGELAREAIAELRGGGDARE